MTRGEFVNDRRTNFVNEQASRNWVSEISSLLVLLIARSRSSLGHVGPADAQHSLVVRRDPLNR